MDAWQLTILTALFLSLEMPPLLELPWVPVVLVSCSSSIALYLWEMSEIKRLEQGAGGAPLKQWDDFGWPTLSILVYERVGPLFALLFPAASCLPIPVFPRRVILLRPTLTCSMPYGSVRMILIK
jgi:hypothetical protein